MTDPVEDHHRVGNRYPQTTESAIAEANAAILAYEAELDLAEARLAYAQSLITIATTIATANTETTLLPATYAGIAGDHIQVLPVIVSFVAGDADAEKILIQPTAPAATGANGDIWVDNDADPIVGSVRATNAWVVLVPTT